MLCTRNGMETNREAIPANKTLTQPIIFRVSKCFVPIEASSTDSYSRFLVNGMVNRIHSWRSRMQLQQKSEGFNHLLHDLQPLLFLYTQCDAVCGEGSQTRTVNCEIQNEDGTCTAIEDSRCDPDTRPPETKTCSRGTCLWVVSHWTEVGTPPIPFPDQVLRIRIRF